MAAETLALAVPPRISVLLLTYASYAAFHASRKPPSVAKSVLLSTFPPFTGPRGPHRLGELDLSFLLSYSLSMFLSGRLADRRSPSLLLLLSSLLSSLSLLLLSLPFFLPLHSLPFFLLLSLLSGLFQSLAWPCVLSLVATWHSSSPRKGLLMGLWNSHTSLGNVLGSLLAASMLDFGWGWSFALPAVLLAVVGVLVHAFLPDPPQDVVPEVEMAEEEEEKEDAGLLGSELVEEEKGAIGFLEAWTLPGVAPFAFCLFFSKLVAYTFLYWLPFYIRHTHVAGKQLSHKMSGILSTIFDVGGVFGGASAGFISDRLGARAITSITFLFFSIPALIFYRTCGSISMYLNIFLMFLAGYFVNGPYSLITTAVAADLGTQDTVKGNSRALATVSAIIDGTGSVGAALGPLLTGYISTRSWNGVFLMLILSNSFAVLFLIRLAKAELVGKLNARK